MKVNGIKKPIPLPSLFMTPESSPAPAREENASGSSDNALRVDSSRLVREARAATAALPEARMERVTELRDAIKDGSYRVESDKIARKMVDEALRESMRWLRERPHPS